MEGNGVWFCFVDVGYELLKFREDSICIPAHEANRVIVEGVINATLLSGHYRMLMLRRVKISIVFFSFFELEICINGWMI